MKNEFQLDLDDARMALHDLLQKVADFDEVYPQFNLNRDFIQEVCDNYGFEFKHEGCPE